MKKHGKPNALLRPFDLELYSIFNLMFLINSVFNFIPNKKANKSYIKEQHGEFMALYKN